MEQGIKLIFDNNIFYYGITIGIVLMTILYTFIRYIYSKETFYVSYCLMQIFSLFYIVLYGNLFELSRVYLEGSLVFATISAVIFSINYFDGRFLPKIANFKELMINTLLVNIVILTSFYHYTLFEYLPYTVVYAILFFSIIFNIKSGFKPTFIYVIGWSIFCFLLFAFDFKSHYTQSGFTDIVLVVFTIEAILFTISLSYKYSNLKDEKMGYESMLFQQSKLAKSGEMIANITHQFRQPLNNLSYILVNLKKRYDKDNLEKEYFEKKMNQANEQIVYLSKTINDFKEFYFPQKNREIFFVKDSIENALSIISADLKKHNIECRTTFNTFEDIKIFGIKNELSQVILAILSNSIDALKDIENPIINIEISTNGAEVIINLFDNGKGISNQIVKNIFNAYYTTKETGTGLGLFLVKQIIENSFQGKIEFKNLKEGCCFSLYIEKAI